MKNIIAFCGRAQSGKDTAAQRLVEKHGYARVAFADGVREMALGIDPFLGNRPLRLSSLVADVGWEGAKQNPEVRRLLQRIGTEGVRNVLGQDTWVELGMRKAAAIDGPVVFTDVRFENEAVAIRNAGGILVRIERPDAPAVSAHVSESGLDDYEPDWVAYNNGSIEQMWRTVDRIAWSVAW